MPRLAGVASRFRFLLSMRWFGMAVLGIVLMITCVLLGNWQYGRYEERAATNSRIAAAEHTKPVNAGQVLSTKHKPAGSAVWSKVSASGTFDADAEVLVRNRSVNSQTGYEVITPLTTHDGEVVLVDRGWVPPAQAGATALPEVPKAPNGNVTITGRVRESEAKLGDFNKVEGKVQARSVNAKQLATLADGPVFDAYVTQDKPADGFTAIPVTQERSWQNYAYSYQWWLFAAMIPVGLFAIARKESRTSSTE